MLLSYQITKTPLKVLYQIGLLITQDQMFFDMIFITERDWNSPILNVIRGVSDSYRFTLKNLIETHLA